MRIGIGVTTYNRPECLAKWKEQIAKHTIMDNVLIYIAEDSDDPRRGVSAVKNECLRVLKDCDHIFLFDDDCYPIKDGWVDFFTSSKEPHLLFLNDSHEPLTPPTEYRVYKECGGVFMYMKNDCVERVGAFDEGYIGWGFEHADYSKRIKMSGVSTFNYVMKKGTGEFLYSEDYLNPAHKSSIDNDLKQRFFSLNFPKYKQPIKDIYIPL